MNSIQIKSLVINFKNPISFKDLPAFRGSVISVTQGRNVLFHNHVGDGYRYSYPLIQYKRIFGKAAIFCIGEGTKAIEEFFSTSGLNLDINGKPTLFEVTNLKITDNFIQLSDNISEYSIHRYLPLNQDNYRRYMEADSLLERYSIIENCLVGNILSFAKSIGLFFEDDVVAKITSLSQCRSYKYKGIDMIGFDLSFKTNVLLPEYIGLGRGVSVGFGVLINK